MEWSGGEGVSKPFILLLLFPLDVSISLTPTPTKCCVSSSFWDTNISATQHCFSSLSPSASLGLPLSLQPPSLLLVLPLSVSFTHRPPNPPPSPTPIPVQHPTDLYAYSPTDGLPPTTNPWHAPTTSPPPPAATTPRTQGTHRLQHRLPAAAPPSPIAAAEASSPAGPGAH